MIDIGGPAMVRAAAKNHAHVGVVVDPADYEAVVGELEAAGTLGQPLRRRLARKAFAHCSAYDAAIVAWLDAGAPEAGQIDGSSGPPESSSDTSASDTSASDTSASDTSASDSSGSTSADGSESDAEEVAPQALPESLPLRLRRAEVLRYGENPGQVGARYRIDEAASWWDTAAQLGGRQMSYLNIYDSDAAWRLAHALGPDPAAVVVKHANPCGVAAHDDLAEAYRRAHGCDPTSAFGGVVALNRTVTAEVAASLAEVFTEVVVAPGYDADALERLQAKPNLRILQAGVPEIPELHVRSLGDTFLVQTTAAPVLEGPGGSRADPGGWQVVTDRRPSDEEWRDLVFAWQVVAAVSSNAIVVARDRCAVGIGAGQQNRRDAGRIAAAKAGDRGRGGAYASDAFFPFADGLDGAVEAGCTAVVQPGGSVRDAEVIDGRPPRPRHGVHRPTHLPPLNSRRPCPAVVGRPWLSSVGHAPLSSVGHVPPLNSSEAMLRCRR